jgi:uncharacterized protein (TIGR03435 family)
MRFSTPIPTLIACVPQIAGGQVPATSPPENSAQFEVASIKPSTPGGPHGVWTDGSPVRIRMLGMNLKQLIGFAYDVEGYRVSAQGAIASEPYDVVAKLPDDAAKLPDEERWRRIHTMTQALLAARFKLTLHRTTTEMSVYRLVVAKTGSKIKELGPNPGDNVFVKRQAGHLSAEQMPMSQLTGILRGELKRPVLDATGIKGVFDVALDWAPESVAAARDANQPDAPDGRPSQFTAVEEQLGLKLETGKSPIEVLVVDHAERGSEN